jgi:trimethylamine corrinoid protein
MASRPDPGETQLIGELERSLLSLDRLAARRVLLQANSEWTPVQRVEKLVVPVLLHIGEEWEAGRVALSQIYMSGRICEDLVTEILPIGAPGRKDQPRMAIAVLEDHHLLGKRIVYAVLRASGYDLRDYGHGISVRDLCKRTLADDIEILLISTLMLRAALRVKDVTVHLASARARTQVVVGGAPFLFDDGLWQEVGATAMGRSAGEAAGLIRQIEGVHRADVSAA